MTKHRVIKLGGSLLKRDRWPAALDDWLTKQEDAERTSIIVGGGEAIDAMRRLAAIHPLDPEAMHWRCVRMLRASFEIAAELFPEWSTVASPEGFQRYAAARGRQPPTLLAVDSFFQPGIEPQLPPSWDTTSDAIAAHLLIRLQADELVLVKACPLPRDENLQSLAEAEIVDRALTSLAPRIGRLRVASLHPYFAKP